MFKSNSRLHQHADSETNRIKDSIQFLVREIVIIRDGGCILRDTKFNVPECNGHAKDGHLILQADHLITRANSGTFSDTRLIVCVCKGHHGWKKYNEQKYNEIVRQIIPSDRVSLWDRCHAARYNPVRKFTSDWKLEEAALRQELTLLKGQANDMRPNINY